MLVKGWALASHLKVFMTDFFFVMGKVLSGKLCCTQTGLVFILGLYVLKGMHSEHLPLGNNRKHVCILIFFPPFFIFTRDQGPVVQSIVSLTSSLRVQLVKCFTTL